MILGLFWDKMTPGVQAQVIRDLMAVEATEVYWTGIELDACLRVLNVRRCYDKERVTVWRTYQVEELEVRPPTDVETIPCVLFQKTANVQLRKIEKERRPEPQGQIVTYNPYNVPMPDPNSRCTDPRVNLIWT